MKASSILILGLIALPWVLLITDKREAIHNTMTRIEKRLDNYKAPEPKWEVIILPPPTSTNWGVSGIERYNSLLDIPPIFTNSVENDYYFYYWPTGDSQKGCIKVKGATNE